MITATMIDSREPAFIQDLQFSGVPKVVTVLDAGDLWASCADGELLVIERKTPMDLLGSIKDGRLFQQCATMRQRSVWAYLVVTGVLLNNDDVVIAENRRTGWRWPDVQGALLSVQEAGVAVVYCHDDRDYEECVLRLSRRERCKEKVLNPRSDSRVMSPAEQLLCALPGVGMERAQALLAEFDGCAARALSWLTWLHPRPAYDISGIGVGTKAGVRKALGLADGEEIDLWRPEAVAEMTQEKVTA